MIFVFWILLGLGISSLLWGGVETLVAQTPRVQENHKLSPREQYALGYQEMGRKLARPLLIAGATGVVIGGFGLIVTSVLR